MLRLVRFFRFSAIFLSVSGATTTLDKHDLPHFSCQSKLLKHQATTWATWEKLQQSVSIVQLNEKAQATALPDQVKRLLQQMTEDCLSRGPKGNQSGPCWAYFSATSEYIASLLSLGLQSYERSESRSPNYAGPEGGYDRVHYLIRHYDQSVSHILAYREEVDQTGALPGVDGRPEFYPRRNLTFISRGAEFSEDLILIQTSNRNLALKAQLIPRSEAEAQIRELFP